MKTYRIIRHRKISEQELKQELGIPPKEQIIEIDFRSQELRISTEQINNENLK